MSDAQTIATEASENIESLIAEMLEGDYQNNAILLGTLNSGADDIQVQLIVTREPAEFMDE